MFFPPTPPYICNFFIFCKKGAQRNPVYGLLFPVLCPYSARYSSITRTAHTSTMDVRGVHGVRDAASVLGLKSFVGPLGDMSIPKPIVQQSFDHHLLNPARREIRHGLSANSFEESHVDLARQLLGRIKGLQRKRGERDRKRSLKKKEREVSQQDETRQSRAQLSLYSSSANAVWR